MLQEGPCHGYPLALAFTEAAPGFAAGAVQALRKAEHEVGCGRVERLAHAFSSGTGVGEQKVAAYRAAHQAVALRDVAEITSGWFSSLTR